MKLQALKNSALLAMAGLAFAFAGCEKKSDEAANQANRADRDKNRVRTVSDEMPPPAVKDLKTCGGDQAAACTENEFCQYPLGSCGTGAAAIGNCMKKPEMCAEVNEPICGCNGKTYANECKAWLEGISVKSKGECPESGTGGTETPKPQPENP